MRPLGEVAYVYLDARYEHIRQDGQVRDAAVLMAVGVDVDGKRQVLGLSVSLSEQELHWREFLQGLVQRGLRGVRLITTDAHAGLRAAWRTIFGGIPWQRYPSNATHCLHLQQNARSYVPRKEMYEEVTQDLRTIFDAPDLATAETWLKETVQKYQEISPRLATWIEQSIPEGLTVFAFPAAHRRRI